MDKSARKEEKRHSRSRRRRRGCVKQASVFCSVFNLPWFLLCTCYLLYNLFLSPKTLLYIIYSTFLLNLFISYKIISYSIYQNNFTPNYFYIPFFYLHKVYYKTKFIKLNICKTLTTIIKYQYFYLYSFLNIIILTLFSLIFFCFFLSTTSFILGYLNTTKYNFIGILSTFYLCVSSYHPILTSLLPLTNFILLLTLKNLTLNCYLLHTSSISQTCLVICRVQTRCLDLEYKPMLTFCLASPSTYNFSLFITPNE